MAITALDTHQTVKDLTAAGFTDSQAEALAYALRQAQQIDLSELATKSDLVELRGAAKSDFVELRGATRAEFAELRREMAEMKAELIKWMAGMAVAIVGAIVAVLKLFPAGHP
jgi:hypothetical protein